MIPFMVAITSTKQCHALFENEQLFESCKPKYYCEMCNRLTIIELHVLHFPVLALVEHLLQELNFLFRVSARLCSGLFNFVINQQM